MRHETTKGVRLTFGKYEGELLTRVPVSYLRYMMNQGTPQARLAKLEFERRGDTMPKVEITNHALDNASLRLLEVWQKSRQEQEGLFSWLQRMTLEAIDRGRRDGEIIKYLGIRFIIGQGEEFPILKTIMKARRKEK